MVKALLVLVLVILLAVIGLVAFVIADSRDPDGCDDDPGCNAALTLDVQHEVERRALPAA